MNGIRIAMWSGPRNISTAMMRAWSNRGDTTCWDEPFYAWYLKETGIQQPGWDEIIKVHETEWRKVIARIEGPVPCGKDIHFLKCMTHHMLPEVGREWFAHARHFFLIRDPEMMLRSYAAARDGVPFLIEELGLTLQRELYEHVTRVLGKAPPVVASEDILADPRGTLLKLCDALGVPFTDKMVSWPAGPRPEDGVWAKHWYASVEKSTGFSPLQESTHPLPDQYRPMLNELRRDYEPLAALKI